MMIQDQDIDPQKVAYNVHICLKLFEELVIAAVDYLIDVVEAVIRPQIPSGFPLFVSKLVSLRISLLEDGMKFKPLLPDKILIVRNTEVYDLMALFLQEAGYCKGR